ncbi:MAG TPA: nucleotidyltransferase family protein [Bradyrhizobium sp.]|uniref:nucleotidyltransferase family protein n=1 Tax=Bradyrhizobium sp. TaxID=376 RepID=UPI002D7FAC7B|nr:nucleotidyltransferase family protein [Bradyrhizobium sp.]HET7888335.1 nucleotidyltransferase family protein [Bradyrhizobium sp.]
MWGVVPAAGRGSRIQPLAFSKELLPVGSRTDNGLARPCAVAEYLVERLILGGADKICFVISPGKSDILEYFGDSYGRAQLAYVVQPHALGLCDAVFRARTVVGSQEDILVGLPDTVWFPSAALGSLPEVALSFLLFPVEHPEHFDAVVLDGEQVKEIQVKQANASSNWIWGAFKMSASGFRDLLLLWEQRGRQDEYFGTLVNSYLAAGGYGVGVKAGSSYVDVGTIDGYRTAIALLAATSEKDSKRFTLLAASGADTASIANSDRGGVS